MQISIQASTALAMLIAVLPLVGMAQDLSEDGPEPSHEHEALEEVVVTATPLGRDAVQLTQSATVLQGDALRQNLANSVGETLARLPGLSVASFGQNVGRPVIRGLQGTRVGMLSNNMNVSDASTVSQDHAVSVEPFLADQIEVLRGPSTLLYGSGSIGGVVNMVSHTIPQQIPEDGYSGRAMAQGNTAANEKFAAGRLDLGASNFAFHANAFYRRTDDYDIPGLSELYPDDDQGGEEHEGEEHEGEEHENESATGVLENSFLDNEGGALGGSWIGERWRFGMSYTNYNSDYGIPGDAHGHEEDEHDEDEHEEDEHEEEEIAVTIGLESSRVEGELVGKDPFAGFEQFKVRFADTSYEHTEYEGEEIGTVFNSDTSDMRMELKHQPWGAWQGAFGLQYTDTGFAAVGEEAFVPSSQTRTAAIFWVESAEYDAWQIDLGVRYDDVKAEVVETLGMPEGVVGAAAESGFAPFSASLGMLWHLSESTDLTFNVSHAERAPNVQELFAFGPHIATQVFEVGDAALDTESSLHMEGSLRVAWGGLTGSLTVYTDRFSDYIYQAGTGQEEDGLPVLVWSQQDADFTGGELELRYDFEANKSGHWQLFGFGDIVNAELANDTNVPLVPPNRLAIGVDWDHRGWAASAVWIRAASHDDVASFETRTPGYDLLNAELVFTVPTLERIEWELFVQGQNLLDEDIRNSASYLKDHAPQIGRNFIFGLRAFF